LGLGATINFQRVAFSEGAPLTKAYATAWGRITLGLMGWAFTMTWVALGMSYTLFDSYSMSFSAIRGAFRF
jgi:sensor histidine kinase YesM